MATTGAFNAAFAAGIGDFGIPGLPPPPPRLQQPSYGNTNTNVPPECKECGQLGCNTRCCGCLASLHTTCGVRKREFVNVCWPCCREIAHRNRNGLVQARTVQVGRELCIQHQLRQLQLQQQQQQQQQQLPVVTQTPRDPNMPPLLPTDNNIPNCDSSDDEEEDDDDEITTNDDDDDDDEDGLDYEIEDVDGAEVLQIDDTGMEEALSPTINPAYQNSFIQFMKFITNNDDIDSQATFTYEFLKKIKPGHTVKFLKHKAYGKTNVDPKVDRPTEGRSNSLYGFKSAISHYMPNKHMQWNGTTGNPTRSKEVSQVIADVKLAEVQGRGKKSQACREMKDEEARTIFGQLRANVGNFVKQVLITTMAVLQFHIIGRSACVSFLRMKQLERHPGYDFAGSLCVKWSKNVRDERDCPPQMLLGAADIDYCVLLHFAIFVEENIKRGNCASGYEHAYMFTNAIDDDPSNPEKAGNSCRTRYRNALKNIIDSPTFKAISSVLGGKVGTHSIRKFASAHIKRFGLSSGDGDVRGRWKGDGDGGGNVINGSYISPDQPFIDANVAAALCHGNPVAYRVHPDAIDEVTDQWLLDNVVPHTNAFFGGQTNDANPALLLAKPLLWAALSPEMEGRMDQDQRDAIVDAYDEINPLEVGVNPIIKNSLTVWRQKDLLVISEGGDINEQMDGPPAAPTGQPHHQNNNNNNNNVNYNQQPAPGSWLEQVLDRIWRQNQQTQNYMHSEFRNFAAVIAAFKAAMEATLNSVNANVCSIAVQPPRMANPGDRDANLAANNLEVRTNNGRRRVNRLRSVNDRPAKLAPSLKKVADISHEYFHGIAGNKPARHFTGTERAATGGTYSRRKPIYDTLAALVRAGSTQPAAIKAVEEAYGTRMSILNLAKRLRKDTADNTLPDSLRI